MYKSHFSHMMATRRSCDEEEMANSTSAVDSARVEVFRGTHTVLLKRLDTTVYQLATIFKVIPRVYVIRKVPYWGILSVCKCPLLLL